MHKKVMIAVALLPILGLPIFAFTDGNFNSKPSKVSKQAVNSSNIIANLLNPVAEAVLLGDGKNYFVNLPTFLEAESTVNSVHARSATYYFVIALPKNMGANLQSLEIVQTEGFDAIDFNLNETIAYFQTESGDRVAISGKAELIQNPEQPRKKIVFTFDPPIPANSELTRKLILGLKPFRNPRYDGVYLFSVSAFPDGDRPNKQFLGYGRLNFYDLHR
jgi:hypothetical protein